MAIMAEWGPKKWEVSEDKVVALQGLSFSFTQVADNNTSTEDKKVTNERGTELVPLTFNTTLHSGAGVDVRAEIESWQALVTQVEYFYLNGKVLGPLYQLRKVSVSVDHLDDFGRIRVATLSLEFREYDKDTTSVKVNTSALKVKAPASSKSQNKNDNAGVSNATNRAIKVGDYVSPTGTKYATGQKIPQWVKDRTHLVSQIKERENKVLLGYPDGIRSWVYLNEVTLTPGSVKKSTNSKAAPAKPSRVGSTTTTPEKTSTAAAIALKPAEKMTETGTKAITIAGKKVAIAMVGKKVKK